MKTFLSPLTMEQESECLKKMKNGDLEARNELIERNMRLVAHVAKKYQSQEDEMEDLISIGTIGVIKAVETYKEDYGSRLATYAARCIDNELLMHFRAKKKTSKEVSLYEPIGTDKEGNQIQLLDVVVSEDEDVVELLEQDRKVRRLNEIIPQTLSGRELFIIINRYGLYGKKTMMSESNEKVCRQYVAEEYQEAFFKFVDLKTLPERMKNEETLVLEYRMKDGDWHRLRFVEKKRDENGVLTHVLCLIRSISDTKKWEHELMYQVEEARKAAALKARFLSNMSHDIRTPMNGIIGTLNLANRYPDDLEVQRKCREQIMTSSKYLVSIVNDILDMNKLESGGVVEQEIPFNLAELLNRVNLGKQKQAAEKNVEYIVDWEQSDIRHMDLAGNPIYVERLLTNISDNAVKFTGPGGSVRVWCAEKYADEERVVYEFGCADTGIGMSETFLEHAFEPFTQENETSRSRYEGTGLGLAIAKKIVDRLDGDIAIESKKGVGTTVTMTLPFKIGEPVEKEKNVNYEEIPVEGLRALLAEDNELNMEITKFMLEDYGIHVECAADGEEAVQKFKNLSWDITM